MALCGMPITRDVGRGEMHKKALRRKKTGNGWKKDIASYLRGM